MATLNTVRQGSGETLVLLHPVGLDLRCWDAVADELQKSFEVVRLDLPGHGASLNTQMGPDLSDYASAVYTTLVSAGIEQAHILGLSFGGMIAQTLAIERPELCKSLIAAGCPCTVPTQARGDRVERGRLALREGMSAVVDSTLERWFTPSFLASGGGESTRQQLLRQNINGWYAAWEAISRLDTLPLLPKIKASTLCIAGASDRSVSVEAASLIAQSIDGATLEVIEGAPHMMQLECPRQFSTLVEKFISKMAR